MDKIRVLIVDDESIARQGLRLLLKLESDIEVIGECANGLEAVTAIQELSPDLVFLDVQMPELDGFGVVEAVGLNRLPMIIFITAYDKYALRAFEISAVDYLLKPFDRERFQNTLWRARKQLHLQNAGALDHRIESLIENLGGAKKYLQRIVVKSGGRIFFLNVEEIDWIEASGNYVSLNVKGKTHLVRETMNGMESKLDPKKFLRIRQSVIVNLDKVSELQPLFKGEYIVLMQDGTKLTSSRGYHKRITQLLNALS